METDDGRSLLRAHWPVVQALKDIDEVEAYLGIDKTRPSLGEPPSAAYARRAPWYDECADIDHFAPPGLLATPAFFNASSDRLISHLRRVLGQEGASAPPAEHSFVLCLGCADVGKAVPLPAALWRNVDAVELRADLLTNHHQPRCLGEDRGQLARPIVAQTPRYAPTRYPKDAARRRRAAAMA